MDAPLLTDDFKEFLRLLNANRVDYLLVGGYAVAIHGYARATVDGEVICSHPVLSRVPENEDQVEEVRSVRLRSPR